MNPSAPPEADLRIERHVAAAVRALATHGLLPAGADSLGLDPEEYEALLVRAGIGRAPVESPRPEAEPAPLLAPLISLLWDHRGSDAPWTRLMAGAIGCACFGEHHLWQDLDLSARSEVSALLGRHFPGLAAANTRGLRWKRYLYLRLGDALGIADLAPPRCDGCDDFEVCFPPTGSPVFPIGAKA